MAPGRRMLINWETNESWMTTTEYIYLTIILIYLEIKLVCYLFGYIGSSDINLIFILFSLGLYFIHYFTTNLFSYLFMLKSLLNNTKYFLLSTSLISTGIYGYCYYRANKNQIEYLKAINSDTLKDASRLSNQSFGISWGFQADDTVMKDIDSGDLFFIKYQCIECLDPIQILKCYRLTIPLLDEEYHALGVAYRDESGLMSYFNQFGENKLMRYSQFVSLPYIKELMIQKTPNSIHEKLVQLLNDDKAFNQILQTADTNSINGNSERENTVKSYEKISILQRIKEVIIPKQQTFKFINRVLKRLDIVSQTEEVVDIRQLLSGDKQVNIRTQTNKTLRSL